MNAFKHCIILVRRLGHKLNTIYFIFYDKLETVAEM